jgi:hypothetical protein
MDSEGFPLVNKRRITGMATEQELQILAAGTLAEVGSLSVEEREALLKKAFFEKQAEDPAHFLGLDFDRWRKDAEVGLYKGICTSDEAIKKLLKAAGAGETDVIKYVTALAIAIVTPYGWLAALLAAVIVPFIISHVREDLCGAWKNRLRELKWLPA